MGKYPHRHRRATWPVDRQVSNPSRLLINNEPVQWVNDHPLDLAKDGWITLKELG